MKLPVSCSLSFDKLAQNVYHVHILQPENCCSCGQGLLLGLYLPKNLVNDFRGANFTHQCCGRQESIIQFLCFSQICFFDILFLRGICCRFIYVCATRKLNFRRMVPPPPLATPCTSSGGCCSTCAASQLISGICSSSIATSQ